MYEVSLLLSEPGTLRSSLFDLSISDQPTAIGRKHAEVIIEDEKCSRLHAHIFVRNNNLYIRDLGSSNGTFVDGEKIELTILKVGSKIRLGGTQLQVTRIEATSEGIPVID